MDYKDYTTQDFILDEYFLRWIEGGDEEAALFWEKWVNEHPEKHDTIEEAKKLLHLLDFKKREISDYKIDSLLDKIHQRIAYEEVSPSLIEQNEEVRLEDKQEKGLFRYWPRVAAVFLGLILFGGAYFIILNRNANIRYSTNFGENKTIILPDQSTIKLNGNSSLHYSSKWDNESPREVWIDGEAFFAVTHKDNHQKFVVHANDLKVEVLGTTFNVNNRKGITKVVLNSGKVKLTSSVEKEGITMVPGDLVEFSNNQKAFIKRKVDPDVYTSWRQNKLTFLRTPLYEVAQILEDNYGLKIKFDDPDISNKKFTGSIPIRDIDVLITSIAESFDLKVIKDKNEITFKK